MEKNKIGLEAILAVLGGTMVRRNIHTPARSRRTKEESALLMAKAAAKRIRKQERNILVEVYKQRNYNGV